MFFFLISRSRLYLLSCFFVFSEVLNCSYFRDGRKYIAFIGTLFRTFSFVMISWDLKSIYTAKPQNSRHLEGRDCLIFRGTPFLVVEISKQYICWRLKICLLSRDAYYLGAPIMKVLLHLILIIIKKKFGSHLLQLTLPPPFLLLL